MKFILKGLIVAGLLTPVFVFASAGVTNVTLNGTTPNGLNPAVLVQPGDNIVISITAQLSDKTKWKGTAWGINNTGATPTCTNTKNAKDGTRNNATGSFTETFIAKAPSSAGLYNLNILLDEANNCGKPLTAASVYTQAVRVGNNTPPVIAAHSDITVVSPNGAGVVVNYANPSAVDEFGNAVPVVCEPSSGSTFPVGNTFVECDATDSFGHTASPTFFTVQVLPPDTTAPVIAPHENVSVEAATSDATGATVTYTTPTATDDRDGAVAVSCTPVSGSTFAVGTTTVACSASDAAGNTAGSTFDVGVYLPAAVVVEDTTAPVIAPHDDIVVTLLHAAFSSTTVNYVPPTASDNVDTSVAVSCTPAPGSTFGLGTTTVTCSAHDAAGNNATPTSFNVGVYPFVPQPVVLASQPDESYLCLPDLSDGWRACYTGGDGINFRIINLGQGSTLQGGSLKGITLSLAAQVADSVLAPPPPTGNPFTITLTCFTDAAYTPGNECTDWVKGTSHNGLDNHSSIFEQANILAPDGIHWTALFTDPNKEANFDGSSPVVFNPSEYYQMKIEDAGIGWPLFGTQPSAPGVLADPYWIIDGLTL